MNTTKELEHFRDLLTSTSTLIDVRAPTEYEGGHFLNSVNLPLLDDNERHLVGVCYQKHGQASAIRLGHELVHGAAKQSRIDQWQRAIEQMHATAIYCWRGGLRSTIAQQWLAEAGSPTPRIAGGYKALRNYCLTTLDLAKEDLAKEDLANEEQAKEHKNWLVLAGRTGSGKTEFLNARSESIDLEGLAHHRGSAFGAREQPQPALPTFENQLAIKYLQHKTNLLIVEDESRIIGRLAIPETWFNLMKQVPVLVLEATQETRITNIYREYVVEATNSGVTPKARYLDAVNRIKRRLGGQRHGQVYAQIEQAFDQDDEQGHREWITRLLEWYYDPMYDYQLNKKLNRVVCRGDKKGISNYLNNHSNSC